MARGPSPANESNRRSAQRDEDDAPWLDEGEKWPEASHTLVGRRTLWTILGVAALVLLGIIIGMWVVSKRGPAPIDTPPPGAEIPLLANPGPWKEEPEGPDTDGVEVEGQGQILFGTGDGRDPGGRIALDALPEDPVELAAVLSPEPMRETEEKPKGPPPKELLPDNLRSGKETVAPVAAPPPPKPAAPAPKPEPVKPAPKPEPAKKEPAPAAPPPKAAEPSKAAGGATLQLGAFSSEARARTAWKELSSRFSYLAGHDPLILPTERDGKTLYRLRVSAGSPSAARDLCGRLKVAGENCTVMP